MIQNNPVAEITNPTAATLTNEQLLEEIERRKAEEASQVLTTITVDQPKEELINTQPEAEQNASEVAAEIEGPASPENTSDDAAGKVEISTIDPEMVATLFTMLTAATKSNFYMGNPKRVNQLLDALEIPVSDDKSFQGFFRYAKSDLENEAYKVARKKKTMPVEVTMKEIMAEAHKRYTEKHKTRAIVNEEYEV